MLADPESPTRRARARRRDQGCIACNQACLDLIFSARGDLPGHPKAGREIEFDAPRTLRWQADRRRGVAPRAWLGAVTAAERGHRVTLYEAQSRIGGQLNLAANVPVRGVRRDAALL